MLHNVLDSDIPLIRQPQTNDVKYHVEFIKCDNLLTAASIADLHLRRTTQIETRMTPSSYAG